MNGLVAPAATCFGKIPSRGDFVRSSGQHQLAGLLDGWVSRAMEALSEDPRWKSTYDKASPIDFAFVGAGCRTSLVGHLRPSVDASGRRYPFMAVAPIARDDSLMFRCAPAGLGAAWDRLAAIVDAGVRGRDLQWLQASLESIDCAADFEAAVRADPLGNFVRHTPLGALAARLEAGGPAALGRIILAIGLLLRPALGAASLPIDKDLVLPLPPGAGPAGVVAGLWLYLVTAFLRRPGVEMQILLVRRPVLPRLILGFRGASSDTLQRALAPDVPGEHVIALLDPEWIDAQPALVREPGVARLAAYLAQPGLALEVVINTFRDVFVGESG